MSTERTLYDESGVALIAALLAVVILSGLAVVFVATSVGQSRATGHERRFETAIHAAEAATDDVILNVNDDLDYHTTYDSARAEPHVYLLDRNGNAISDEEDWARTVAEATDESQLTTTGGNDAVGIRPQDQSTGEAMDLVFGVSYVPDRASALAGNGETRVIRLKIQPGAFSPQHAFLVDGDLTLGGGAQTDGITGNVHANGDVFVEGKSGDCSGSGLCVRGLLSMTGTLKKGPATSGPEMTDTEQATFDDNHVCTQEDLDAGGPPCSSDDDTPDITEGAAYKDTGKFNAMTFYDPGERLNSFVDPVTGNVVEPRWWVLCPDGTVREPTESASGWDTPQTVCNSAPVFWTDGQTNNFHGWDFVSQCGEFNNKACWNADKLVSGAYYVYDSSAVTNGGSGSVSVLVGCAGTDPDPKISNCSGSGDVNGNYVMKGQPEFQPALNSVHFVADRDVIVNGQAGTELDGFIIAREQVDASGTGDLNGSIIATDCQVYDASTNYQTCTTRHTSGSIVELNSAKGSFRVSFNGRFKLEIPGLTQILAWNEL